MSDSAVIPGRPSPFTDSRSRSVWLWQLILAAATVGIATLAALFTPWLFTRLSFIFGLILVIVVTQISLIVPWHRLHSGYIAMVPFADIAVILLLNSETEVPLWLLSLLPIIWLATYYSFGTVTAALMLIGGGLVLTKSVEGIDGVEGLALLVRVLSLAFVAAIVHVSASRNRSSGKLLRAQAVRMESALERAGDRLAGREALLDTLGIGIARIGRDGVIEVANSSFKRFYLYDEGPAFGHSLATEYDSYRGKAVPWYMTSVNRASRGEIFSGLVVWMYGLDGEWRALETSTRNLEQGVEGNDDATALLVRDITGEAGSRESRTLRSVVHELRNPLTAVLGHLDLVLDRDDLDADIRSQLEIVERASERLHVLVDDILSNGEAHRNGGDLSYSLADVVRASTEAFTPVAQNLGVTLTLELDDPLQLCGDAFGMRQVVDNVLSNAIKYSPRGSLVTIRGRRLSEDPAVVLEITDTGLGIAEDELPRIFEMEYRTMSARESDVPGTGLGLGISRNIVEQNGGRMRLDSRLGQGTAVTIVLPTTPEGEASS